MDTIFQDLRYAVRMLRKSPGFTLVATITLALGIGANTTIFSAMNAVVFQPFSFQNQDRLVMLWERQSEMGYSRGSVAPGNFNDWREQGQTLDQIIAITQSYFDITEGDQPERYAGYKVSATFFDPFGVKPMMGRTFTPEEDQPGRDQVVVLKHSLWQNRFGADPDIVGKTISINSTIFTCIGVMGPDFNFPFNGGEMWSPLVFDANDLTDRKNHYLQVLGLLKPGVTIEQANEDINQIAHRAALAYPDSNSGKSVNIVSMTKDAVRGASMYSPVMLSAVGFVLLIACANVANLLLVRAATRQKEIAIRLAIGAGRFRLIRQLLTESLLLALIGGAVGLLISVWGVDAIARGIPDDFSKFIPGWQHVGVDKTAFVFTLIVSALTGLIFGLAPALQATKLNFSEALKEGGKGSASKGSSNRARSLLVVSEIALSLVLLIGAGLMIRSFVQLMRSDLGVNPTGVLTMQISLSTEKYSPPEQRVNFYQQLLERVSALPGVLKAGATSNLPLSGSNRSTVLISAGQTIFPLSKKPDVNYRSVSLDYFTAIGTRISKGRNFTDGDRPGSPRVALVNEAFANQFFADQEPVGQQFKIDNNQPIEIIGVVANVINNDLDNITEPDMYLPFAQDPWRSMFLVIHTGADPNQIASAVRSEASAIDKSLPVFNIKAMQQLIGERLSPKRLATVMIGFFGLMALVLASVGIYAVMSYSVTQRTHEIGIRMALGARPQDIFKLVVGHGIMLTAIGLVIGLAGAFAMTRAMSQILYGVTATDPLTFIGISLLLASIALLACYIPARRATKVDPMVALRYE